MKVVKTVLVCTLIAFCLSFVSCKSTKQSKNKDELSAPETEVVEQSETVQESVETVVEAADETTEESADAEPKDKKTLKAEKKAAKAEAKAAKKAEKAQKKAEKKNKNGDGTETTEGEETEGDSVEAEVEVAGGETDGAVEASAEVAAEEGPAVPYELREFSFETTNPGEKTTGGALGFIGWVDVSNRKLDYKNGLIRLKTNPKIGNFNISILQPSGKYKSVLSTNDECTNSAFYLRVDKKIYKLISSGNVKSKSKKVDSGLAVYYQIKDVAEVVVSFMAFPSINGESSDMLKVTASIKNIGNKVSQFSLKSVLDTVLGESNQFHFYSSTGEPVKSEVMYRDAKECKYIVSKNNDLGMYVFVDGKDVSPVENIALANFSTLDIQKWEPDMLSYRTFDTVLDYNNSAVGIEWPKTNLEEGEIVDYVFYLGFNVGQGRDECVKYIWPEVTEKDAAESVAESGSEVKTDALSHEVIGAEKVTESQSITGPAVEVSVPAPGTKTATIPKSEDIRLTNDQLSPEYIQNLLDRIAALEEDDKTINEEEILQLNAELDAILEVLRL